jgi:hypothetical protein
MSESGALAFRGLDVATGRRAVKSGLDAALPALSPGSPVLLNALPSSKSDEQIVAVMCATVAACWIVTHSDRLRLEAELKREFLGLLDGHPRFRHLPLRKREEMARGAAWGAIKTIDLQEVDFLRDEPPVEK